MILSKNIKAFYSLDYIDNLGVDCENFKKNPVRFIYTIKEDFCKPKDQGKLDNTSNICFRYIYTFLSNIDLLKWSFKYLYYVCLVSDLKILFILIMKNVL
jgi:hypothetical protein